MYSPRPHATMSAPLEFEQRKRCLSMSGLASQPYTRMLKGISEGSVCGGGRSTHKKRLMP